MARAADFDCDVAVVGSGIAGALIAWKLASAGAKTIVLEAGPVFDRAQGVPNAFASLTTSLPESPYPVSPWAPIPSLLDPNSYFVQTGPNDFASNYERQVGGTTWHWLGTAIRLVPNDFRMRSTYGVALDWPISYDHLEPWYLVAENTIGVAGDAEEDNGAPRSGPYPMPPHPLTWGDTQFAKAAQTLGLNVTATPQARVSVKEGFNGRPQCCGNAFCIPMCPIGAKYDATVHVEMAKTAGAEIRDNAVVFKLDAGADGRITALHYRNPEGKDTTLTARIVVVAAHAIETPKLLLMSRSDALPNGLANTSDQVGRNLMDHPSQLSYALANDPMGPYRAPLSTAGIESLRDGDWRKERSSFRIEIGNDGWSWPGMDPVGMARQLIEQGVWGVDLYERITATNLRAVRMAGLTEQLPDPNSRVTLSDKTDAIGLPRPEVHYVIDDYSMQGLAAAREQFTQIFNTVGVSSITHVDQIQGAGHIMGTHRMGDDAKTSVTDSFGRAWDHPNLWLAGSGLFPTTGTGNPTLTIAALALRAVPEIASDLAKMGSA
ncbi:MAG: GMC family oxidoreductase, partial [Thermomicrobiales bacterium]|nr:GMC family oxidoreductase [Thermomicrobiales bacterium]